MTSRIAAAFVVALSLAAPAAAQSARVIVLNGDAANVGFNDPTPAAPIGGNPGITIGQQALNVFQTAANRWAANLQSQQPIVVVARFIPQSCSATSAVLGSAGARFFIANVAPAAGGKALVPNTFYPAALAEKLTRVDITQQVPPAFAYEIQTQFNSRLGQPGCLTGSGWYYGLDNGQPANRIDLLAVVMHEFGHGLGVSVGTTSAQTGVRPANGYPSVWESNMLDLTTGKRWLDMTSAERAASAVNTNNLVWAGRQVTNVIPSVLDFMPEFSGISPAFPVQPIQPASFGPALSRLRGIVVAPADGTGSTRGCSPYGPGANTAGNIVLVDRGVCTFVIKVKHAQDAGAMAVIVANNAAGLPGMGGADPTITIPSWGVTQALGAQLRASVPADVQIVLNPKVRLGTTAGFARLFAPNPFQGGSSVSHFDTSLTPSVLMEPSITSDLTTKVKNPFDLTLALLRDIGW